MCIRRKANELKELILPIHSLFTGDRQCTMSSKEPKLCDVEYLILARAIAQKKFSKGLFSASNVSVTGKWKQKVLLQMREWVSTKRMPHDIAVKLHSGCPHALLKKLKIRDIVESVIRGGEPQLLVHSDRDQLTLGRPSFETSPRRPPSAPPSITSHSPNSSPRQSPSPPSSLVSPDWVPDLSSGCIRRRLRPRQVLAHWAVGSNTALNSVTKLLQLFQRHCPVVDFKELPLTAGTLLKVCFGFRYLLQS